MGKELSSIASEGLGVLAHRRGPLDPSMDGAKRRRCERMASVRACQSNYPGRGRSCHEDRWTLSNAPSEDAMKHPVIFVLGGVDETLPTRAHPCNCVIGLQVISHQVVLQEPKAVEED